MLLEVSPGGKMGSQQVIAAKGLGAGTWDAVLWQRGAQGPNPGLAHHLKEGTFWWGPRWTKSGEGVWASRKVLTGGSGMSERGPVDELTGFVNRGRGSQVRRGSEGVR